MLPASTRILSPISPQDDSKLPNNKQLEEIIYTISHDLNAPLRHTKEFSRILIKKLGDRITQDEQKYVYFIEQAIMQAEAMMEALLEYSRLNTRAAPFEEVDTHALVTGVVQRIRQQEIGGDVLITIDKNLPVVMGDIGQLQKLFYNLIENALTFQNKDSTKKVHIFSEERAGLGTVLAVKDNGIGIAPQQHNYIFGLFKRLGEDGEKKKTGMGLALCKNIVERHGGKIWVESSLGKGATFYFTIAK